MRLARMLANRASWWAPAPACCPAGSHRADDAAWLRVANPMPAASESALVEVSAAVLHREHPAGAAGEAAAAPRRLGREASSRPKNTPAAILQMVQDPRGALGPNSMRHWRCAEAQHRAATEREDLLARARFGFVAEAVNAIQAFAQHTLHEVDSSYGWAGRGRWVAR
jgi:hypothetical protein